MLPDRAERAFSLYKLERKKKKGDQNVYDYTP